MFGAFGKMAGRAGKSFMGGYNSQRPQRGGMAMQRGQQPMQQQMPWQRPQNQNMPITPMPNIPSGQMPSLGGYQLPMMPSQGQVPGMDFRTGGGFNPMAQQLLPQSQAIDPNQEMLQRMLMGY